MILIAGICLVWLALGLSAIWIFRLITDMNRLAHFVLSLGHKVTARLAHETVTSNTKEE